MKTKYDDMVVECYNNNFKCIISDTMQSVLSYRFWRSFSSDITFLIFRVLQLELELKTVNKIMIRNSLLLFIFTTIFLNFVHVPLSIS